MQKLQELLATISQGIRTHFNHEEVALLKAFEEHGNKKLLSTFQALLLEHEEFRNHLTRLEKQVAESVGGELSRQTWEASTRDIQTGISNIRKQLASHVGSEMVLLQTLRSEMTEAEKTK